MSGASARPRWHDMGYRIVGGLLFVMGAIGLVLPVWPTTIFWILAALAFARSWPAMRDRIYAWPRVGSVVEEFAERGTLSRKGKQHAVFGMLIGLAIAVLVKPSLAVAAGALVAAGIAYVLTRPETRPNPD